MPAEFGISGATLVGALLLFVRVAGTFVFIPIPGATAAPATPKIILSLAVTVAMFPHWPQPTFPWYSLGWIVLAILREAAIGITVGLVVALTTEMLRLAFQALGLQAGYTYASVIDPATQADTGVLQVLGELASGLLFFALGLHRQVLLAFVRLLDTHPPGMLTLSRGAARSVIQLGADTFLSGLRLALPVVVFLMIVDISLALMGRLNTQLQLVFLAFPAKMLTTLVLLSFLLVAIPRIYQQFAESGLAAIGRITTGE
jgi:flagellar biosynthetic protein FliR